MIGVGLGVVAKRRYSGFPFALRSFWQRVRDDGGTMQDYNSAISLYRSNNDALLAVSASATKAGKLYSVLPVDGSGDFTVTAANGTRINKDGLIQSVATNVPRINWKDGRPYVLREVAATNLLLRSEEFSHVTWVKNNCTFTGDTLTANAGTAFKTISQVQTTNGEQTFYFDLSYVNHRWIQLLVGSTAADTGYKNIDIQNKSLGSGNTTGGFTATIQDFDTFLRITVTVTTTNKVSISLVFIDSGTATRAENSTSTGSIKLYRAQNTTGSTASSYIKTVTTTETRDADIISVALPAGTAKVTTNFRTGSPLVDESPTTPYTMPVGEIESVIMED
jgi:hypothetical protein